MFTLVNYELFISIDLDERSWVVERVWDGRRVAVILDVFQGGSRKERDRRRADDSAGRTNRTIMNQGQTISLERLALQMRREEEHKM